MEFSSKYHETQFPERYATKHGESLSRRLNNRREQHLLERSLALVGRPESIADIGCGPGRFWRSIERTDAGDLFALDLSHAMLSYARQRHAVSLADRYRLAAGSVMALPFIDGAFDCVVSMRLLHHFGDPADRRQALAELARVSRNHLIVSLWTDGNYKAWRRRRLENRRGPRRYQNRHVVPQSELGDDFKSAGLNPVAQFDLIPTYSQWRYYVLEQPGR